MDSSWTKVDRNSSNAPMTHVSRIQGCSESARGPSRGHSLGSLPPSDGFVGGH
jgi:hypothetical protein